MISTETPALLFPDDNANIVSLKLLNHRRGVALWNEKKENFLLDIIDIEKSKFYRK